MSSRDEILASIRANRPKADRSLPFVPSFEQPEPSTPLATFKQSLERMGRMFLDPPVAGDALQAVRDKIVKAKVVCSAVPELVDNRDLADVHSPLELADVDIAIVRASFAVAETGSVLLSERDLQTNALAYLPQHIIVLLDPADIVVNLHHAYRRPELHSGHYASFNTGPFATAYIKGVLIHGAQGVGPCRSR